MLVIFMHDASWVLRSLPMCPRWKGIKSLIIKLGLLLLDLIVRPIIINQISGFIIKMAVIYKISAERLSDYDPDTYEMRSCETSKCKGL